MNRFTCLILLALVAGSCGMPRMVTTLTPEAPRGKEAMGREYISLESEDVILELGFDGFHGDYLVFDLVVINQTDLPLELNPSDYYYVLLDSSAADTSKLPPRMALHPERVVHNYDRDLESIQSEKTTNTILGFLEAGVGLLANTTAFLATDDPGYVVDAVFGTLGTAGEYAARDKAISHDISLVTEEKEVVKQEIFRKGSLPSGKVKNGFLFFPRYPEHGYLMFCFPVSNQLFQFVYHQDQYVVYD